MKINQNSFYNINKLNTQITKSQNNSCEKYNNNVSMTNLIASKNASDALRATCLGVNSVSFKGKQKIFTEKDINFQVTCVGCGNIEGNTRELYDYRCPMDGYGIDWYKNFNKPHLIRNGNLDEKYNGDTTAIVFPLHPNTPGLRGKDNMTVVISGKVSKDVIDALVVYMAKVGVLNAGPTYNIRYYVNSTNPKSFMKNYKIRTVIAQFLNKKIQEEANKTNSDIKTQDKQKPTNKFNISENSINIANVDCVQNKDNKKVVKDYIRPFLKNGRKFTVLYETQNKDNDKSVSTVILIPSAKNEWDFLTIQLDANVPEMVCKNLINTLVKNKMVNVDSPDFRKNIVNYFNSLENKNC